VGIQKVVKMAKICKLYILINLYKKYIGKHLELIQFFFRYFPIGFDAFLHQHSKTTINNHLQMFAVISFGDLVLLLLFSANNWRY